VVTRNLFPIYSDFILSIFLNKISSLGLYQIDSNKIQLLKTLDLCFIDDSQYYSIQRSLLLFSPENNYHNPSEIFISCPTNAFYPTLISSAAIPHFCFKQSKILKFLAFCPIQPGTFVSLIRWLILINWTPSPKPFYPPYITIPVYLFYFRPLQCLIHKIFKLYRNPLVYLSYTKCRYINQRKCMIVIMAWSRIAYVVTQKPYEIFWLRNYHYFTTL